MTQVFLWMLQSRKPLSALRYGIYGPCSHSYVSVRCVACIERYGVKSFPQLLYISERDNKTLMWKIITLPIPTLVCVLQVHVNNLLSILDTLCVDQLYSYHIAALYSVSDFLRYIGFITAAPIGPTHAQEPPQRPKGLQSSLITSL